MSLLSPTVQEMIRSEFPGSTISLPAKLAQVNDPVKVAEIRQQMRALEAKRSAEQAQELRSATVEYAKLALPGCIACADSLIANPDEIAKQAIAIGRAFAIELGKI